MALPRQFEADVATMQEEQDQEQQPEHEKENEQESERDQEVEHEMDESVTPEQQQLKLEMMDDLRADGEDDDDVASGKRRLFRFKPAFDVVLVREVIHCFPWAAGYGRTRSAWMSVATCVQTTLESMKGVSFTRGTALDHAIVKRRVDMLLEAYRKNEMAGLRGTGTPEEFDMRNKLLAILAKVVDEQTLNKGAMREKRVQSALQVAQQSLAELESTGSMVLPASMGKMSPSAVATSPAASLMPIAPAPASTLGAAPAHGSSSPGSASQNRDTKWQNVTVPYTIQQNGSNKRPLRAMSSGAASIQEIKRSRGDKSAAAIDAALGLEERKLRLEERRVALEEEKLAWDKEKAQQEGQERQMLLDVLRAQGSLVKELLVHLRNYKMSINSHEL
ncbi:hypothetical protein PsorP6_018212 [Peronosclerospora sorghi]|uniref:Uncharacterized protein n=1 Tax=Peronosclerospora sorghi TaxID=230839 RepID=A0ACC0WBH1_9STRA|nr:hypothetical protein PsorP6_018212 [Peronosclerospora sorghi]